MKIKVHSLLTGAFTQREISLNKNEELDLGTTPNLFQTIRVITGQGIIKIDDRERTLKTNDLIQIMPDNSHIRIRGRGPFTLELFITSSGHI